MNALINAELLRVASRKLVWGLLVVVICATAINSLMLAGHSAPLTESDYSVAHEIYQESVEQLEIEAAECERVGDPCQWLEESEDLKWQNFLREPLSYDDYIRNQLQQGEAYLLLALIALVVVVVVGSDFPSGALATQLTFTPRRTPVLVAKVLAGTVVGLVTALAAIVSGAVTSTFGFLTLRPASDIMLSPDTLAVGGRYLIAVMVFSLVVGLLTMLVGSPVGAIISGSLVLFASEMWQNSAPSLSLMRMLPTTHISALLDGHYSYYNWYNYDAFGESETWVVSTFPIALLYFTIMTVLLGAISIGRFQRRDLLL